MAYAAFLDYLQDNYITSEEILTVFADVAERVEYFERQYIISGWIYRIYTGAV